MLFQVLFGAFVRWRVNRQITRSEVPPLHKMVPQFTPHICAHSNRKCQIHQWLGRAVFMLGLAQIPLGLYVYGSPKSLFILYAVCAFMFLASWFILEYLKNRGWFHHRYGGVPNGPALAPEMTENRSRSDLRRSPDMEPGYSRVGADEDVIQSPKKSRFGSWFNRRSQRQDETIGVPYNPPSVVYDETTSAVSSRAPTASPLVGGLAPRKEKVPPVPQVPSRYDNQPYPSSGSSLPDADYQRGYNNPPNPTGLSDTVLRDSTTLGQRPHQPPLEMPSPRYGGGSYGSSGSHISGIHSHVGQIEQMPHSPTGGYMEADNGFVTSPAQDSPARPLPLPPHRRERSTDSSNRLPVTPSIGGYSDMEGGQTVTIDNPRGGPNVAVQVKLNPDGKTVTVRRLPQEEAEQERRERSRVRRERALQREMEIGQQLETHRRSESMKRGEIRQDVRPDDSVISESMATSYTPSVSGHSTTIAGASGGLLGRPPMDVTPSPVSEGPISSIRSPMVGMHPIRSPPAMASQRASVTSGGTAENSEIEQEIIKEQRRKKRREERSGQASGDGGMYGPRGTESQWT
jgi:hypothetical protein